MKESYTIGEFSDLFDLDVQTLRYYDRIGLISPNRRDPKTGWRFYEFDQVYKLASIRFMRKLGYSIEEVAGFFQDADIHASLESLREHSRQMKKKWERILFMDNVIQRKLAFVEKQLATIDTSAVTIKQFPERLFIPIGQEESLYLDDLFYCYPTVVFYQRGEKQFGAFLASKEDLPTDEKIAVSTIPAGTFLCGYHVGPYDTIAHRYQEICRQHPDCHPQQPGVHINFNVLDQFVENDSTRFITEIQVPLQGERIEDTVPCLTAKHLEN